MNEDRIDGVSVGYGKKTVLNDIDLHLDGPGLYCIIGPNGVGKSTLIKCINKILKPTKGTVSIDGTDISGKKQKEIAEKVAYVPVNSEDLFSMSVFYTIMVGRSKNRKWCTSAEDIVKVDRVLIVICMEGYANHRFNELSAGQHQMVAIARGLIQDTVILILDEPTANLDVRHRIYVTAFLQEVAVKKGIMVLMISHNLSIASIFADQVILMAPPGRIKAIGPAEDVVTADNTSEVYDVGCMIVEHQGRPVVLLDKFLDRGSSSNPFPSTSII